MRLVVANAVLYLALGGWMVCTYFCTIDGHDDIPAVRNSYCRPHRDKDFSGHTGLKHPDGYEEALR